MSIIEVNSIKDINRVPSIIFKKKGTCSNIYKLNDNKIIKVYKNTYNFNSLKRSTDLESNLIRLSELESNSFIMPNDIYKSHNKVIAITMDYINGNIIKNINNNIPLDTIIENLKVLEEDLYKITKRHILLRDMHDGNIMYDDSFKVIDMDGCIFDYHLSEDILYKSYNLRYLKKTIVNALLDVYTLSTIEWLDTDLRESYNKDNISDFVKTMSDVLETDNKRIKDLKVLKRNKLKVLDDNYYKIF